MVTQMEKQEGRDGRLKQYQADTAMSKVTGNGKAGQNRHLLYCRCGGAAPAGTELTS